MTVRDEYRLTPVAGPDTGGVYEEELDREAADILVARHERVAEAVAWNAERFGPYTPDSDGASGVPEPVPGTAFLRGARADGRRPHRNVYDVGRRHDLATCSFRLDLADTAPGDALDRYDGGKASALIGGGYQFLVSDAKAGFTPFSRQKLLGIRGLDRLSYDTRITVRDEAFNAVARALNEHATVDRYLDRFGITVEGVNDGSTGSGLFGGGSDG